MTELQPGSYESVITSIYCLQDNYEFLRCL